MLRCDSNSPECCCYVLANITASWPQCLAKSWAHRALLPGAAMNSLQVIPSNCSPDFFLPKVHARGLSAQLGPGDTLSTPPELGVTGLHMYLSKSWLPVQECGYQLSPGLVKQMKCCLAFQKVCLNTSRTLLAAFMQNLLFAL